MNILVTGGAGFIGSHLVDAYINRGDRVTVIDNLVSGKESNLNPKAKFYKADILDKAAVEKIFKEGKLFDVVVHLAAQKSVTDSVKDPLYDAQTNICGTLNLLEIAKKNQVNKLIFSSTGGALYGDGVAIPTPETAQIMPESPYGIAKYSTEHYLRFYSQFMKIKILRYANVFGPRQDPLGEAGVVAIFSQKIIQGDPINIFGDGNQSRDFIYVGDIVAANVKATDLDIVGTWNIGTGKEASINQLVETLKIIAQKKNLKFPEIVYQDSRLGELTRSCLDPTKADKDLGWQATTSLQAGLTKTLESFE